VGAPVAAPYAATADDLAAASRLGDLYLRSLMRTQLRLGLSVVGALVVLLGGIPLACAVFPSLREASLGGVPVPWLLVAAAPHPVFIALGTLHLRQADANERGFADLMTVTAPSTPSTIPPNTTPSSAPTSAPTSAPSPPPSSPERRR
jgi:hypothetical protein